MGSTPLRTLLYRRILKTYYQSFSGKFLVLGVLDTEDGPVQVPFDKKNLIKFDIWLRRKQ